MIQTNNKMNKRNSSNNDDDENNENNRSNARFSQSILVSASNFWRANFVRRDEGERREEKMTRVVAREERQVVYQQILTSKSNIKEQARVKRRPNNINLKRLPNKKKSSMVLFSKLSYRSQKEELSAR